MVAVNHGSCMVLPSPHFMPQRSLEAVVNEKCNVIYGTPTSEFSPFHPNIINLFSYFHSVYVDLIAKQKEIQIKLPETLIANTAGAICSPILAKDIQEQLNVKRVRSIYGQTEVTSACFQSLQSDDNATLENSIGFISDHVEVEF